jgi:hypothetical protein
MVVAPGHLSPLAVRRSDKGLIHPAALRAPRGITKTDGARVQLLTLAVRMVSLADPTAGRVASSGMNESFVTDENCAR